MQRSSAIEGRQSSSISVCESAWRRGAAWLCAALLAACSAGEEAKPVSRRTSPLESGDRGTYAYLATDTTVTQLAGSEDGYAAYAPDPLYRTIDSVAGAAECGFTDLNSDIRQIEIGFNFDYYSQLYSSVFVSVDGFLSFAPVTGDTGANQDMVGFTAKPRMIAGWWDDMVLGSAADCKYVTEEIYNSGGQFVDRIFTVQWSNWRRLKTTEPLAGQNVVHSMQIRLHEKAKYIDVVYGPLEVEAGDGSRQPWQFVPNESKPKWASASVGISDGAPSLATTASLRTLGCTQDGGDFCDEWSWLAPGGGGRRVLRYRPAPFRYIHRAEDHTYVPVTDGTPISVTDPDEGLAEIALPAPFVYGGRIYNYVFVSTNGFIAFTDGIYDAYPYNQVLPNPFSPNNIVAGWWDDMIVQAPGDLVQVTRRGCDFCSPGELIIQWSDWRHYDPVPSDHRGPVGHSMQIHLFFDDSRIEVHYGALTGPPEVLDTATVGIEDAGGTADYSILPPTLTCAPDCREYHWPANKRLIYEKPTWSHIFDRYFASTGPGTLHCFRCHDQFRDMGAPLAKSFTLNVLHDGVFNLIHLPEEDPPACDTATMGYPSYIKTHYGVDMTHRYSLLERHGDMRLAPLSNLVDAGHSYLQWFRPASANMPWDCSRGDENLNIKGKEELETWFVAGAKDD